MKLNIAGKPVALKLDATISITRSSPALNEDTGSFSFPFPVPTLPNQQNLGWPGRLQRAGDIADQSFVLEEQGLQVMRGIVDYDQVTKEEIGVILKSGITEFRNHMSGKNLADIGFGSEPWLPAQFTNQQVIAKLLEWDTANTTSNGKYVVPPFAINAAITVPPLDFVNEVNKITGKLVYDTGGTRQNTSIYMLQFRIYFLLEKIFESAGYTVLADELKTSEFSGAVMYSRIINIRYASVRFGIPGLDQTGDLYYSQLMPNITVLQFVDTMAKMFCMMFDIDERKKTVKILFKKNIFAPDNVDPLEIVELKGWQHSEESQPGGFSIKYAAQDDTLDTKSDYIPDREVSILPAPTIEDEILKVTMLQSDYITVLNGEVFEWKQIGRLKEYTEGTGSQKIELEVKIPRMIAHADGYPVPKAEITPLNRSYAFAAMTDMIIAIYHGRMDVNGVLIPYSSGDRWGIADGWSIGLTTYLAPEYLYLQLYKDFLEWKAYRARAFTKYIELSLPEVLNLRFDKKYVIDGIEVILDIINFELPHRGVVKIDGFTS